MKPSEHAIEDWAKMVLSKPKRSLTEEEARKLVQVTLAQREIDSDKEICEMLEKKQAGFLTSIFWWRVKCCHTYEITPSLCAYIGECVIKSPGMSTMMANYLQWFCFKNKIKKLTLEDFAKKVFPFGVPKDEVWDEMWSLQKVKTENCMIDSDNGLDHQELMKSIINITE